MSDLLATSNRTHLDFGASPETGERHVVLIQSSSLREPANFQEKGKTNE